MGRSGNDTIRSLQAIDMEAFALLTDIMHCQKRKFFDPLCEVSAGMLTNWQGRSSEKPPEALFTFHSLFINPPK